MCGENLGVQFNQSGVWGSPPRVRGKLTLRALSVIFSGITPACAGKTVEVVDADFLCEDHPRVCGENSSSSRVSACREGSPPRVRGKRASGDIGGQKVRITPACAGKTHSSHARYRAPEDHPRVCGENFIIA